ncbi:FtsX-like permease family protein [Dyadobacter soli]|uniref:FtsX-like permease family protein n=1 Tax=Dyadobacter soli TaxID=659014 RepID=A0A1G7HL96_9BACT|nr:ABC transporter permease [Dyadobacter soli]SDF01277.1 FtsX-like permease family protein [Dyadobacter soli]
MLKNYLKIALRTLAQSKVYSVINITGLSIGLAAAMLIMLYTKDEVSYDGFHVNNPNIYRITFKSVNPAGVLENRSAITGYLPGPKFSAATPEIEAFTRFHQHRNDLKVGDQVTSQEVHQADRDFFKIFSFRLLSGNPLTALSQPRSVVISEETAEKHFGTVNALGKTMLFKDAFDENAAFEPFTVTGVAAKCPQNSSIQFEILQPLPVPESQMQGEAWFNSSLNTFVKLTPGADTTAVSATMNRIYQSDARDAMKAVAEKYGLKNKQYYALQPFTAIHLDPQLAAENGLVNGSKPLFSYVLSGIALFIMLIACINFVNLTVARSLKRAKEIGVRKVVGGGRYQLAAQFLGESFVLCFAAFVLAILLVESVLPTFNNLANKALSLSYLFDWQLIAAYIALFILTALLAGFYPAVVLSGYDPVKTLYSRFNFSGRNYLQKTLVVVQFALASFLIIVTLTMRSQFNFLTNMELGYDDRNLLSIEKQNLTRPEAKLLTEELLKNHSITAVSPKNGGQWGTTARINGGTDIEFSYETVGANYLSVLKIPLLQGRKLSGALATDSTKAILVNETFVKKAGWKKPLGQVVDFWYNPGEQYTVVGVVKDYHFQSLTSNIRPQLFTMKPGNVFGKVLIRIKPGTESASLGHIGKTFRKLFPLVPYSYQFIDEANVKSYESEAKWKQIMLFGAVLTIFISCIGLFGLATLAAERRTKEIGIRKVLGASVAGIVTLLSSDFVKLVALSFVVSFPAAYYAMQKWLENYPYKVEISAWIFLSASALSLVIALCTVSFQSVRTALMNPVKSLRSE